MAFGRSLPNFPVGFCLLCLLTVRIEERAEVVLVRFFIRRKFQFLGRGDEFGDVLETDLENLLLVNLLKWIDLLLPEFTLNQLHIGPS